MIFSTPAAPPRRAALSPAKLDRNVQCDALVVGSGVSGALAAFHLAEAGMDVIVVEQRSLAAGATAASTALVQYELDVPLVELIDRIGRDEAQAVYRATRRALDDLRALIESNRIECSFAQRPSLYLARTDADVDLLQREAAARREIGLEAELLDRDMLAAEHRVRRPAAIRSNIAYQLDPRAMATELLTRAASRGTRIYDRTPLRDDIGPGRSATRETADGHTIRAKHIIYATGYHLPAWLPDVKAFTSFQSTYALLTRPVDPATIWPGGAMLWETGSPYFYARTSHDNRLIIGGEDDSVLDPAARQARLFDKTRRLLEELAETTGLTGIEVDTAWASTFATTPDGLPLIGMPTEHPACSFSLGFGGNGIVFALLGAQMIRAKLLGESSPLASIFSLDRAAHGLRCMK